MVLQFVRYTGRRVFTSRGAIFCSARVKLPYEIFLLRSSLTELILIVAYIRRFLHNATPNPPAFESDKAFVRLAQADSFLEEVAAFSRGWEVKSFSEIFKLHPILVDETLRLGGHFANAPISESRIRCYTLETSSLSPSSRGLLQGQSLETSHL